MRYVLVTPPAALLTTAEAKAHLRVDHSDEDTLIDSLVAAATQHLDGRAGILGRAIVNQAWRLDVAAPCGGIIVIDMPDVSAVASVKYLSAGVETTWDSAEWRLGALPAGRFFIEPKDGYSWPAADDQEDAFRVAFTAGFGAAAAVPAPLKAAVLLLVGHWYEHREEVVIGQAPAVLPRAVDALIAPYRVRALG